MGNNKEFIELLAELLGNSRKSRDITKEKHIAFSNISKSANKLIKDLEKLQSVELAEEDQGF